MLPSGRQGEPDAAITAAGAQVAGEARPACRRGDSRAPIRGSVTGHEETVDEQRVDPGRDRAGDRRIVADPLSAREARSVTPPTHDEFVGCVAAGGRGDAEDPVAAVHEAASAWGAPPYNERADRPRRIVSCLDDELAERVLLLVRNHDKVPWEVTSSPRSSGRLLPGVSPVRSADVERAVSVARRPEAAPTSTTTGHSPRTTACGLVG